MVPDSACNNLLRPAATTFGLYLDRLEEETNEGQEERKIDVKECKEHRLCSLGGYNYLAAAVGGTGNTISHVRRRRCREDSPGVKCPIVTTSQCVYSLRLSIRHTYSAFAAWVPASLATSNHYEKMQMLMKFRPAIYQELRLDKFRDMVK